MDRLDHNAFRSLLNETYSVLNSKNNEKEMTLEEAVASDILTEEELEYINSVIFENSVVNPNILNLVEQIENYYGVELTEQQLDELFKSVLSGIGSVIGGAVDKTQQLYHAGVAKSKRKQNLLGRIRTARKIEKLERKRDERSAALSGEEKTAAEKSEAAGKSLAARTARRPTTGTTDSSTPSGGESGSTGTTDSSTPSGGESGSTGTTGSSPSSDGSASSPKFDRHKALRAYFHAARGGDRASLERFRAHAKKKGIDTKGAKVRIGPDGKLHVVDASGTIHKIFDHYVFARQNGILMLENIIRK